MLEKGKYINKYTPEDLAKLLGPVQRDGEGGLGADARVGAIAGTRVGIPPAGGGIAEGTTVAVQGAEKDR